MSLSAAQQRVLDGIADGLRRTEPKLAAMYAMFTRLCGSERPPIREQLTRRRVSPFLAAVGAVLTGRLTQRGRSVLRMVLIASQIAIAIVLLSVFAAPTRLWCPTPATANGTVGK